VSSSELEDYTDALERAEARARADELEALEQLANWVPFCDPLLQTPEEFVPICKLWDRIAAGEAIYALISGPPQIGKSTYIFYGFARHLRKHPRDLLGYFSYNAQFAAEQSGKARIIAQRSGVWTTNEQSEEVGGGLGFGLSQSIKLWHTREGGGCKFIGRGTSAIGSGFKIVVVDDPLKNREEAEQSVASDKAWNSALADGISRLAPGGSFICTHQRWNETDPIGRFRERIATGYKDAPAAVRAQLGDVSWVDLELQAMPDPGPGEPYRPLLASRFGGVRPAIQHWARRRAEVGEYNWASQYNQNPVPPGGRLFAEGWPFWMASRDERGNVLGLFVAGQWFPVPDLGGRVLALAIDSAGTEGGNDWTAGVLGAIGWEFSELIGRIEPVVDLLWVWREQLKTPDVVDLWRSVGAGLPGVPFVYETQGGDGRAQAQTLQRDCPEIPIHMLTTVSSKLIRNTPAATASRRGRFRVPQAAPWLAAYLKEVGRFTGYGDRQDDQVDATGHLWNYAIGLIPPMAGGSGGARETNRTGAF
jgi:hypothetical protein